MIEKPKALALIVCDGQESNTGRADLAGSYIVNCGRQRHGGISETRPFKRLLTIGKSPFGLDGRCGT